MVGVRDKFLLHFYRSLLSSPGSWIGSSNMLWNFCKKVLNLLSPGFKKKNKKTPQNRDNLLIWHQSPEPEPTAGSAALRCRRLLGGQWKFQASKSKAPFMASEITASTALRVVSPWWSTWEAQPNTCSLRKYSERLDQVAVSDKV